MMLPVPLAFEHWYAQPDQDIAIELITSSPDGWPHVAHLSVGEIVYEGGQELSLALWRSSHGVENLLATGKAVLLVTMPEGVHELRFTLLAHSLLPPHPKLHAFRLRLVSTRDKSAPYADIVNGIRFRLKDPEAAHTRWRQVQQDLAALWPASGASPA